MKGTSPARMGEAPDIEVSFTRRARGLASCHLGKPASCLFLTSVARLRADAPGFLRQSLSCYGARRSPVDRGRRRRRVPDPAANRAQRCREESAPPGGFRIFLPERATARQVPARSPDRDPPPHRRALLG